MLADLLEEGLADHLSFQLLPIVMYESEPEGFNSIGPGSGECHVAEGWGTIGF